MKNRILFSLIIFLSFQLCGQDKFPKVYNNKKWSVDVGLGQALYSYIGLKESRNEINCHKNGIIVNQNIGRGPVLNAKLSYSSKKNSFAFSFNYYFDRRNSNPRIITPIANIDATVQDINSSKAKELIVYDNQSYLNLGLGYQRKLISSKNERAAINANLFLGYSINKTPERLEYDYYLQDYVTINTDNNGASVKLGSTFFRDGFFISPGINFKYNTSKNHGILIELSGMYQQHQARYKYFTDGGLYKGETPNDGFKYKVIGAQLKLNYFFNI